MEGVTGLDKRSAVFETCEALHLGQRLAGRVEKSGVTHGDAELECGALQCRPEGEDFVDIAISEGGDERTAPGAREDEPLVLEQSQRFTQRRPADVQLAGEPLFVQSLAWLVLAGEDSLADGRHSERDEARRLEAVVAVSRDNDFGDRHVDPSLCPGGLFRPCADSI